MLRTLTADFLKYWRARPFAAFLLVAGALTSARVITLVFADANLGPDEAQYWVWSKAPAFGYYSKPPLIAWVIAATTGLFGDAEWAVRIGAPFFHFGAGLFLFVLARRLYGSNVAFWAGAGWMTLPGAAISSALITTDAPLLFFWSAALYFFFRVLNASTRRSSLGAAFMLGAAIGLGMLSKYAMIYFPIGVALAAAISRKARTRFRWPHAVIALAVAAATVAPNFLWNASHNFETIAHTAANANWKGDFGHPGELAEFIGAQFGVFGPITMVLLIWGLATMTRRLAAAGESRDDDLALLALCVPPLLIVSVQAFLTRAHANWAAAAYPAALILVTAWAVRARLGALVRVSAGAHLAIGIGFLAIFTNFALADAIGMSNAVKRVRGWPAQGAFVKSEAEGYDAILVDDRELMGSLLYYARGGPTIVAWNSNNRIDDHYEAFMAYDPEKQKRVLFVAFDAGAIAVQERFGNIAAVDKVTVDLQRGRSRTLYLFDVSGFSHR
jgi:4-amino-4-deoxy-L-arabinose transferase-like glycosyltransferase